MPFGPSFSVGVQNQKELSAGILIGKIVRLDFGFSVFVGGGASYMHSAAPYLDIVDMLLGRAPCL